MGTPAALLRRDFRARLEGAPWEELLARTVVVLPSLTFPPEELAKIKGIAHYEERLLFCLLWLRDPRCRLVYVTSRPLDRAVVDYYLGLAGCDADRLTLLTLDDPSPVALSCKLESRPDVLAALRDAIAGQDAFLLPFNVTPHEQRIAELLGIPVFGPLAEEAYLGSKSGSRRVARAAGVPLPPGFEDLGSLAEVERALDELSRRYPGGRAVVKLNYGFSGQGNALVDLGASGPLEERPTVFCAPGESWASFGPKVAAQGAVVELLLRAPGGSSPSAQLRILPSGRVELLSTHDQILGGPDDQVYLGCRFPAAAPYRAQLSDHARAVGEVLAAAGVMGPFALDFVALPAAGSHRLYFGEINLRMGGTTHPYFTASLLTGAHYDPASGELMVERGPVCYAATDNLSSPSLVGLTPRQALARIRSSGMAFDPARGSGVVLHMLGALPEHGKLGAVCIASSRQEADELLAGVGSALGA